METELLGTFKRLIMYLTNYLLLFLTVVAFIFVDVGMWYIDEQIEKSYDQFEEHEELVTRRSRIESVKKRGRKVTTYKHTGYGYSGEAGHDVLVTDTLAKRLRKAMNL